MGRKWRVWTAPGAECRLGLRQFHLVVGAASGSLVFGRRLASLSGQQMGKGFSTEIGSGMMARLHSQPGEARDRRM